MWLVITLCPSYEDVKKDKLTFAKAFKMQYEEQC